MNNKRILLLLLFILLSGCAQLPFMESRTIMGKRLFEQKCVHCHQLPKLGFFRNREHIKQEVKMMRDEDTSWISSDEAGYIVDYIVSETKL